MEEFSLVGDLLILVKSAEVIASISCIIAYWCVKLLIRNIKLELEKSISDKVSKEDLEEIKEKLHKMDLLITSIKKNK